jgi:hypothetical protein
MTFALHASRRRDQQRAAREVLRLRARDGGPVPGHRREANVALATRYDALARRWVGRRHPGRPVRVETSSTPEGGIVVTAEAQALGAARSWFVLWFGERRSRKAHSFATEAGTVEAGRALTACGLSPYDHSGVDLVTFGVDDKAPRCEPCAEAVA